MSLSKTQKTSPMLGESEKIYRTLIENANLGVAVIQDGKKVYSNSWLATLAGYTVEEFQHIELVEAIHPDDREFTFDRIRQRLEQNTMDPDLAELRILTKSGEAKWIETNSTFILWDDRPAIQAFIIDITDRKSAISITISIPVATNRFRRPTVSASAPEGTSSRTMDAAQAALSRANCSRVRPKSKNRMVKTG